MKILVAIGGNALGKTPSEQKEIVKTTAKKLVEIVKQGHDLVIVHGNGPQVGMISLAFSTANEKNSEIPQVDFPECGSMSQGYIGYHLQNAINYELKKNSIKKDVVSIITQVVVSNQDTAFLDPSKPIGNFYSEQDAKKLASELNWTVKNDANRGWRRVIASPKPVDVVEKEVILNLLKSKTILITAGGGGIPVIETNLGYQGVPAVIDKDFAAATISEIIDADKFVILTAVDKVMINYKKENELSLDVLTLRECEKFIIKNEFAEGSMLPKIEAAVSFVKRTGKGAWIGSLDKASEVINEKSGTLITK